MDILHMKRPLAIKSLAEDGTFYGYASVFGALDSQNEIVEVGAFKRSLAESATRGVAPAMLWMHDPTIPIGLWVSLSEDKNGLRVEGRLALGTQKGREAYELLKMGALTGLSIGYRVLRSRLDAKRKVRILTDVELFEISLVTFPANDAARVSAVKSPRGEGKRKQVKKTRKASAEIHAAGDDMTRAVTEPLRRAARALKQNSAWRN